MVMHPEHLKLHVIRGMLRTLNAEQFTRKRKLTEPHVGETGYTWKGYDGTVHPMSWSWLQGHAAADAAVITELLEYRSQLLGKPAHCPRLKGSTGVRPRIVAEAVAKLPPKAEVVPA